MLTNLLVFCFYSFIDRCLRIVFPDFPECTDILLMVDIGLLEALELRLDLILSLFAANPLI